MQDTQRPWEKKEKGNLSVILSAAYLHDIGLKNDKNKENSYVQENHEQKGVAAARKILEKLKAKEELIKEVCNIVGHHHHPEKNETINFKILHDADLITNLEDENKEKKMDSKQLKQIIDNSFLTDSGREKADEIFF